jgi:predicted naringenin-chalcone synthase
MSLWIHGLGTAVPSPTMTQQEAVELAQQVIRPTDQQTRLLKALYRRTGVKNRHTALPHRTALDWVPAPAGAAVDEAAASTMDGLGPSTSQRMRFYSEHAPPLAISAASHALEQATIDPSEITHLITVTCTGFTAPGVDTALITALGLRPTTERIQVGFMGCHGAINGIRVARSLALADPHACPLLCAVELCSLHFRFGWDEDRVVANALFADGAAALATSGRQAADGAWSVVATGSCLVPDSEDAMTWRIGDHGFEMTLSARVPELVGRHLRPWLAGWLEEHGLSIESVGSWAVHPGGPRILSAVSESLGLPPDATAVSRDILAQFGNMSSPTVLFILDRLRKAQAPRPCVALGFGPGMFAEVALLT